MRARTLPRAHDVVVQMGNEQRELRSLLASIADEWECASKLDYLDVERMDNLMQQARKLSQSTLSIETMKKMHLKKMGRMPALPTTNGSRG